MNLHPIPAEPEKPVKPKSLYRRRRLIALAAGIFLLLLAFPPTRRPFVAAWRRFMYHVAPVQIDESAAVARIKPLLAAGQGLPLENGRIVIDKSERRLDLYNGDRLVRSFKIALGRNPVGAKTEKGDGRTPEGEYFICTRLKRTPYHLFMGISYPNPLDARRALRKGLIDTDTTRRVVHTSEDKKQPPWDTKLGGAIGIHGSGVIQGDWTLGCIAMENVDVEEVWVATRIGTAVEIRE